MLCSLSLKTRHFKLANFKYKNYLYCEHHECSLLKKAHDLDSPCTKGPLTYAASDQNTWNSVGITRIHTYVWHCLCTCVVVIRIVTRDPFEKSCLCGLSLAAMWKNHFFVSDMGKDRQWVRKWKGCTATGKHRDASRTARLGSWCCWHTIKNRDKCHCRNKCTLSQ